MESTKITGITFDNRPYYKTLKEIHKWREIDDVQKDWNFAIHVKE